MQKTAALGIDLGTSNSALALRLDGGESVESVPILQVTAPGTVADQRGLPSALFFPNLNEHGRESFQLPWQSGDEEPVVVTGTYAREAGARQPDRLVHSAKSWLCNAHVDPRQPILPWRSAAVEQPVSPLEASRRYLAHIKSAFLQARGGEGGIAWEDLQVVVTVPASFDEVARRTTAEAVQAAGLGESVILLEEPQAAFYAWVERMGHSWRDQVRPGEVVLVCDVGGGTTDFSLIAVSEVDGELDLERICVGDHILLGGDNIDLALAFALRQQLETEGRTLDEWQFSALVQLAREAKEQLFDNPERDKEPIAIPSQGSGLFSGTVSTALSRDLLQAIAVDGFFALTGSNELPEEGTSAGLQEFGLPYAADPVVSKHLAAFLRRSARAIEGKPETAASFADAIRDGILIPNAILFNGGAFRAEPLRKRVLDLLGSWSGGDPVRELEGADLDQAVARGASAYGFTKVSGKGMRIRAGASRSYYIGVESAMMAIPGYKPPQKALCVVPQGMEEGSEAVLDEKEFALLTGVNANFRFFSSSDRSTDTVGTLVSDAEKQLEETARLELPMAEIEGMPPRTAVPVKLHSRLTELGTLELWMQHTRSEQRWKLDFEVRTE